MSSDPAVLGDGPAIQVKNLGKLYTLYHRPVDRLKHGLFRRMGKSYGVPFWALQDISFEVAKGETFGVIGRNGSGKSTLLQLLAGTLHETTGQVKANGRVAALLELGAGFNPDFTGRENVLLNGMILGVSRQEMLERFAEIEDFADIGDFIDQPVKVYSSGMFVRLAFAVAIGVDADILLIDEALAVGDLFFRQKCYQRLERLRQRGVSIILVSHSMNEIEQFCESALLLEAGRALFLGSAIEAVKRFYIHQSVSQLEAGEGPLPGYLPEPGATLDTGTPTQPTPAGMLDWPAPACFLDIQARPQVGTDRARCTALAITDKTGRPAAVFQQGELACFYYEFEILADIEVPIAGLELVNERGVIVHGKNSLQEDGPAPAVVQKGSRLRVRQAIELQVAPGEYSFNLGLTTLKYADYLRRGEFDHPDLDARVFVLNNLPNAGQFAVIHRQIGLPIKLTHFGLANLPDRISVEVPDPKVLENL